VLPAAPLARHHFLERLAEAFALWQWQRPDLLTAWAAGEEPLGRRHGDEAWLQPAWAALHTPAAGPDRIACAAQLAADLAAGSPSALAPLPSRLGLFAVDTLPAGILALVEAAATQRPVHWWAWSETPHPWADLPTRRALLARRRAALREALAGEALALERAAETTAAAGHPLAIELASHGRAWWSALARRQAPWAEAFAALPFVGSDDECLLGRLQRFLAADAGELSVGPDDDRLRLVAAPDARRELEALHQAIVAALAEDDGLRPDAITVLLADPATYGPLIPVVFDKILADGGRLPWRLHSSLAPPTPLGAALLAIIDAGLDRGRRSEIADLLALPAVRAALAIDDGELAAVLAACDRAGVRWGLDTGLRQQLQAPAAGGWPAALARLRAGWWLGPASGDAAVSALPGNLVAEARLAAWLETAGILLTAARHEQTPQAWLDWTRRVLTELLTPADRDADGEEPADVAEALTQWQQRNPDAHSLLDLRTWRAVLEPQLPRASGGGGAAGGVVCAPLATYAGVPAEFIAVVGLDAGRWPRRTRRPRWDILRHGPATAGDPDGAAEDLHRLWLAIQGATGRLRLSWIGRDERSDRPRPPALVIERLLRLMDGALGPDAAGRRCSDGGHGIFQHLPRHAPPGGPWAAPLDGLVAAALLHTPLPAQPFVPEGLQVPVAPRAVWHLDDLRRTLRDPAGAWLRHAVDLRDEGDEGGQDDEAWQDSGLGAWQLGHRLLQERLPGPPPTSAAELQSLLADGVLPPGEPGRLRGRLAQIHADTLRSHVGALTRCALSATMGDSGQGGERRLNGVLLHDEAGPCLMQFGNADGRSLLDLWLAALLWGAAGRDGTARLWHDNGWSICRVPSAARARRRLGEVLELADRCHSEHRIPPLAALAAARERQIKDGCEPESAELALQAADSAWAALDAARRERRHFAQIHGDMPPSLLPELLAMAELLWSEGPYDQVTDA
jgi:exodeoxyribonuclease V gamma subunit